MNETKCKKCGSPVTETYQRGQYITGTRCLSCKYETLAKSCKNVGELRLFMEKMSEDTGLLFEDETAFVMIEAHFVGEIGKAEKIKVWKGKDK